MATIFTPRFFDPGTYTSPSIVTTEVQNREVKAAFNLSAADLADPLLEIGFAVEGSPNSDGVTGFVLLFSYRWRGGVFNLKLGGFEPPEFGIGFSDVKGYVRLRAIFDINKRARVGGTIEVI